ncbi:MAG: hypothetical protein IIW25_01310 [Bacteroidales bacterium]|nr:hypothetical protein [Bacteroidales bacterium]
MRTAALIIILLSFTSTLKSQNIYQIFKATQGVTLSNTSVQNTPATKRMEIKMSDMLHIPEGGEVAILEKSTRQIYTYNAPKGEKVKVAKILIDAKKQAGNSIAAINNELMTSINEKKLPGYNYSVHGATYRGAGTDSITISVYSALCNALAQQHQASTLALELEHNGDSFQFKATNSGSTPVYFNIIRLGETPHICIPTESSNGSTCLIMDANSTWSAGQIRFTYEEGDKYLLFATDIPFNSHLLQQMFNRKEEALSQTGCTVSVVYAVKE